MTYSKYHTEGIILRRYDVGEADCGYLVFTRDLGLIYAKAKSVREIKSKLRFGLQELSVSEMSFVKGKEVWRITHSKIHINPAMYIVSNHAPRQMTRRLVKLLLRLLPIEEPYGELYDVIRYAFKYLDVEDLSEEEVLNFEALIALRTLKHLGYVGQSRRLEYLLASPYVNDMLLAEAHRVRTSAVREINRALRELPL